MCHFADLDSCIYYIYTILHVSQVLNRPLCYNQFHAKICYGLKIKLNQPEQTTEGNNVSTLTMKSKERKKPIKYYQTSCIIENIGAYFCNMERHFTFLQIIWPHQESSELSTNFKFNTFSETLCTLAKTTCPKGRTPLFAALLLFKDLIYSITIPQHYCEI